MVRADLLQDELILNDFAFEWLCWTRDIRPRKLKESGCSIPYYTTDIDNLRAMRSHLREIVRKMKQPERDARIAVYREFYRTSLRWSSPYVQIWLNRHGWEAAEMPKKGWLELLAILGALPNAPGKEEYPGRVELTEGVIRLERELAGISLKD